MKFKFSFTLILALLLSVSIFAQNGFTLSVEQRMLNGVDSSVFVLEVDRAFDHDVKKAWAKMIKKHGKVKAVTKDDLTTVSGVIISSIDKKPIDIYSSVTQLDSSVKVFSVFMVDSARVDPNLNEGKTIQVRKVLSNFGGEVYKNVLERELEEKQDQLETLIKGREKNLKAQDSKEKSIQSDSLKIANAETEIELQKGQLEGANSRYVAQKTKVAGLKKAEKEELKLEKSRLKEFDKERKSIQKDIDKQTAKILDLKAEIRDYWYQVEELKKDFAKIETQIKAQRGVVEAAKGSLNSI